MKINVERTRIVIFPESAQDEAYIEEVLGLKSEGDALTVVRHNAIRLSCMSYIEIQKPEATHVDERTT